MMAGAKVLAAQWTDKHAWVGLLPAMEVIYTVHDAIPSDHHFREGGTSHSMTRSISLYALLISRKPY